MTTAALAAAAASLSILARPVPADSIFRVEGRDRVFIRAGVAIAAGDAPARTSEAETEVEIPAEAFVAGADFFVCLDEGRPVAFRPIAADTAGILGGFHVAPGGNAAGRQGGDDVPAINPFSCWDAGFRPACADQRGMALVTMPGGARFWADIYLLGVDHARDGSSRFGAEIADGDSMPDGLDFAAATAALARHGKQLLSYDEFRVAAFGVTERSAAARDPERTGLDAARTSRFGLMQATGNLWVWGTDGDSDDPRPSLFGGSWLRGSYAGSRCAALGHWPGYSLVSISARGRCDHLQPE